VSGQLVAPAAILRVKSRTISVGIVTTQWVGWYEFRIPVGSSAPHTRVHGVAFQVFCLCPPYKSTDPISTKVMRMPGSNFGWAINHLGCSRGACLYANQQCYLNPLKPSGYYMYHQFNIQQFNVLPTQCVCVSCGSQNKQQLFPYTALTDWFV